MTYTLDDVAERKAELKAAMPELELFDYGDFGLRLEAFDPVSRVTIVVMRPFRSSGASKQEEMNQPTEKVVAFFKDERARQGKLP